MFNPYDEQNHAGLLTGMSTHGIGLRRNLGGPLIVSPLGKAALGVAAQIDPTRVSKDFQQKVKLYMQKDFSPPAASASDEDKALYLSALYSASHDKFVKAYLQAVTDALQNKLSSIVTSTAVTKAQARILALTGDKDGVTIADTSEMGVTKAQIAKQATDLDNSIAACDSAFDNFLDWLVKSANLIKKDDRVVGYQSLSFGDLNTGYPDESRGMKNIEYVNHLLYGQSNPYLADSTMAQQQYFSSGPALQDIPWSAFYPAPANGKSGVLLLSGNKMFWQSVPRGMIYAPITDKPGRIRYIGAYASQEPAVQGFFTTRAWNQNFLSKLNTLSTTFKLYKDAQADLVKKKQELSDLLKVVASAGQASQDAMDAFNAALAGDNNAYLSQLSGFTLGYAKMMAEQLENATTLDALSKARDDLLKQNDAWTDQYKKLMQEAQDLQDQANKTDDPILKKALNDRAGKKYGEATAQNNRVGSLVNKDGAIDQMGQTRSGIAKKLDDNKAATGVVLPKPVQQSVDENKKLIDDLNAKMAQQQQQQQALAQQIKDDAGKLPQDSLPPNIPPPPPTPPAPVVQDEGDKQAKKGGGTTIALAAAGVLAVLAAMRK
jgi:hypothetical protein